MNKKQEFHKKVFFSQNVILELFRVKTDKQEQFQEYLKKVNNQMGKLNGLQFAFVGNILKVYDKNNKEYFIYDKVGGCYEI